MLNVMMNIPNPNDATSWYRGVGPFSVMRKNSNSDLNFIFPSTNNWATYELCDVAFFQRPYRQSDLESLQLFKSLGKKVIVDYDDLLLDVPTDNPTHSLYSSHETMTTVAKCIAEADLVFVSTQELKNNFRVTGTNGRTICLNKRVLVVNNALHQRMIDNFETKKREKIIVWRGSETHQKDLMNHAEEIIRTAKENPDWHFCFLGYNPWFITDHIKSSQCTVSRALSINEYHDFIKNLPAAILIVPLDDNKFNRCKSNIAWIEATYMGAAALCPDWPEWRNPGAWTYEPNVPGSFYKCLKSMIDNWGEVASYQKMSFEKIKKDYNLTKTSNLRLSAISTLAFNESEFDKSFPEASFTTDETVMELE